MELPLDDLRAIALRELARASGQPLFVTISGAHLYGFSSPDSDFDVRGCHLVPLEAALSIAAPRETVEYTGVENGREIDFVSHDAAKFFRMMLRKNGYVMEQIFSPIVVRGGPDLDELRSIAKGCITRHIHHHYRGFYQNQRSMAEKEEVKKAKTLLYAYRVLLTGIHVLRTGEIEANLPKLLELYPRPGVPELMAAKVKEKAGIPAGDLEHHRGALDELSARLEAAFGESKLPEEPREAAALDRFLVSLRLRGAAREGR
ncbi:MAG TPA: nucleotidyltransferase domain-containing protein [Planctomycetota bacterium]|nr:nucleotidyltransferase domain-containing protein [Planctomycetota bacterium]